MVVRQVELHSEPAAGLGEPDRESLWVTGCVGRVMDRAGETCATALQRGFDRDDLFGVENSLVPSVFLQKLRIAFCDAEFGLVAVEVEHTAAGVPELQALAMGEFVHQALAVARESELGKRVCP